MSKPSIRFTDGYYIRYREIGENLSFQGFNILTVVAQKSDFDAYSHVIQNLRKASTYQVFVAPFYKSVEGTPSNTRIVSSADDRKYFSTSLFALFMHQTQVYIHKSGFTM